MIHQAATSIKTIAHSIIPTSKRARADETASDPEEKKKLRLDLAENPTVLDRLLRFCYRSKPHSLSLYDFVVLDDDNFSEVMALLRMAKKYEVTSAQDMLEQRLW